MNEQVRRSETTVRNFTVRRAAARDTMLLHTVAAATFRLACPPASTEENVAAFVATHLSVSAFEQYLADPRRAVFLAEENGEPIGYSMLLASEPADRDVRVVVTERPTIELSKFYVVAEAHGLGVAGALMSSTIEEASGQNAASVWLGVNQQNARANRFYEKSGFLTVGTKRFRLGDGWEDDFVKERRL